MNGCAIVRAIPRFLAKIEMSADGHQLWAGARSKGGCGCYKRRKKGTRRLGKPRPNNGPCYGKFWVGPGKKDTVSAHVFAAWLKGLIPTLRVPAGMHLAHGCQHGSLCVDCIRLVPAEVNLKEARTAPIRAVHPPRPKKLRSSVRARKNNRVTRKVSPAAKIQLTHTAAASTV